MAETAPPAPVGRSRIRYHDTYTANCPYCRTFYCWTDSQAMAAEVDGKDVEFKPTYHPGIQVGKREPLFIVRCPVATCGRPYVVEFKDFIDENTDREVAWRKEEGRYHVKRKGELEEAPPARIFIQPKWVTMSLTQYVSQVRGMKNPIVRTAIVTRIEQAGWRIFPPTFRAEAAAADAARVAARAAERGETPAEGS